MKLGNNVFNLKPLSFQDFTIIICFFGIVLIRMINFANDPGLGWHLKVGEWIYTNHQIPQEDLFSFASAGKAWLVDQWLGDLILYLFYQFGGWAMLYCLTVITILYVFVYQIFPLLVAINPSARLLATLVVVYVYSLAQVHFIIRPVIFSFLFFSILYFEFYKIFFTKKLKLSKLLLIGAIVALWVNIHPSFLLIWVLLGILVISLVFERLNFTSLVKLIIPLSLTLVLASLVTPDPLNLYVSMFDLSFNQMSNPTYEEWAAPELQLQILMGIPFALLLMLIISGRAKALMPYSYFVIFSLAMWFVAGGSARLLPYFAITVAPLLYLVLINLAAGSRENNESKGSMLRDAWWSLNQKQSHSMSGGLVFSLIIIISISYALVAQKFPFFHKPLGPSEEIFPYQAVQLILDQTDSSSSIRVINDVNYGGFITWAGAGRIQPFIDDRTTLHGYPLYQEFAAHLKSSKIKYFLSKYQADYLLLEVINRNKELINYFNLSQKDSIVYQDQKSILINAKLLGRDLFNE